MTQSIKRVLKRREIYNFLIFFSWSLFAEPEIMPKGFQVKIAKGDNAAVLKFLDRNKDNINSRNQFWENPLIIAAKNGQYNLVSILVEKYRAPLDAQDRDGYTALMGAAQYGYIDVVRYLVKMRADKTYTTFWGDTAYDCAQNDIAEIYGGPFKDVMAYLK